jgi:hypothetical protein
MRAVALLRVTQLKRGTGHFAKEFLKFLRGVPDGRARILSDYDRGNRPPLVREKKTGRLDLTRDYLRQAYPPD